MSKTKMTIINKYAPDPQNEVLVNPFTASSYNAQEISAKTIVIDGNLDVEIASYQYSMQANGIVSYVKALTGYDDSSLSKVAAKNGAVVTFASNFSVSKPINIVIENGSKVNTIESECMKISNVTMSGEGQFVSIPKKALNVPASFLETAKFNPGITLPFDVANELPFLILSLNSYKANEINYEELIKILRKDLITPVKYSLDHYHKLSTVFDDSVFNPNEFKTFYLNVPQESSVIGDLTHIDCPSIFSSI